MYGNISVKGHGNEQHYLPITNEVDEKELSNAANKGDNFMFSEMAINHFGGSDRRRKIQVSEGEVGQ